MNFITRIKKSKELLRYDSVLEFYHVIKSSSFLLGTEKCVVCNSPYVAPIRLVPTIRTRKDILLKYCMHCSSFSNPSGYKEDESQLKSDLKWSINIKNRNFEWAELLLEELKHQSIKVDSILEIGCGIGTLLYAANKRGMEVLGFDTNKLAVDYGKSTFGINLLSKNWTHSEVKEDYDLLVSISVLEHLEHPQLLMKEMAEYCKIHGAYAFISVPFLEKERWKFLLDPDPNIQGTPFFDNDVHVTHFSQEGLIYAFKAMGAQQHSIIQAGGWKGILFSFDSV